MFDDKFGIAKGTMTTCTPTPVTSATRPPRPPPRPRRRAQHRAHLHRRRQGCRAVLPQLKGKLNGTRSACPPNASIVDLVVNVEKKGLTAEEVNAAFKEAFEGDMKGVLAITETPLVSVDFRCSDVSTTIDAALTMVMGDDMVKVVAWYDNGGATTSSTSPTLSPTVHRGWRRLHGPRTPSARTTRPPRSARSSTKRVARIDPTNNRRGAPAATRRSTIHSLRGLC